MKIIILLIAVVVVIGLFWFVVWPKFKQAEYKLKLKVRDVSIGQIKHQIKKLDISKEELFDE